MQQQTRVDTPSLSRKISQREEKSSSSKKANVTVIDKQNSGEDFPLDTQVIEQLSELLISWVTY